jgi:VanZ family protein
MGRLGTAVSYAAPLVAYCALVFGISALSAPPAPEFPFEWGDKITHACAFGAMCLLAVRAGRALWPDRPLRARLLPAVLFCLVYGGTDEIHQYFVPGRSCDVFDWIADIVGAAIAAWALPAAVRWRFVAALVGEPLRAA